MTIEPEIIVHLKFFERGQLKGFADVTISFGSHEMTVLGFRIVRDGDQPPWIALPTSSYMKDGEQKNKKVVSFSRKLDQLVKEKVLEEYEKQLNASMKWVDGIERTLLAT